MRNFYISQKEILDECSEITGYLPPYLEKTFQESDIFLFHQTKKVGKMHGLQETTAIPVYLSGSRGEYTIYYMLHVSSSCDQWDKMTHRACESSPTVPERQRVALPVQKCLLDVAGGLRP